MRECALVAGRTRPCPHVVPLGRLEVPHRDTGKLAATRRSGAGLRPDSAARSTPVPGFRAGAQWLYRGDQPHRRPPSIRVVSALGQRAHDARYRVPPRAVRRLHARVWRAHGAAARALAVRPERREARHVAGATWVRPLCPDAYRQRLRDAELRHNLRAPARKRAERLSDVADVQDTADQRARRRPDRALPHPDEPARVFIRPVARVARVSRTGDGRSAWRLRHPVPLRSDPARYRAFAARLSWYGFLAGGFRIYAPARGRATAGGNALHARRRDTVQRKRTTTVSARRARNAHWDARVRTGRGYDPP